MILKINVIVDKTTRIDRDGQIIITTTAPSIKLINDPTKPGIEFTQGVVICGSTESEVEIPFDFKDFKFEKIVNEGDKSKVVFISKESFIPNDSNSRTLRFGGCPIGSTNCCSNDIRFDSRPDVDEGEYTLTPKCHTDDKKNSCLSWTLSDI